MTDLWMCQNCGAIVELDKHGRCSVCGSDAVVRRTAQHQTLLARLWPEETLAELEELWLK
jgi:uncharacterized paraquat-inducible protein A